MTTYGFEAEFSVNASAVIARLHARGLAGDPVLHGYHCDCDYCELSNGYAFRGQTDSSCSGEIISDILGSVEDDDYPDHVSLMAALCDIAVDVDAEPGNNAGFHVHVGITDEFGDYHDDGLGDALWQFVLWEPVLARIAGGRWSNRRNGMNVPVRDQCEYIFRNYNCERVTTGGLVAMEAQLRESSRYDFGQFKRDLLYRQRENDRHSNLNISARNHPTWEFRLWNSTRSAWRMELYCGLSVALLDPAVVTGLSELSPPTRMARPSTGIADVALACANGGHDRVAELLERQAAYLNDRADSAPSLLTTV